MNLLLQAKKSGGGFVRPPSKETVKTALAQADEHLRPQLLFTATTATHGAELDKPRWTQLDLVNETVELAGKSRTRTIPLGAMPVAELRGWRLWSRFSDNDDLVFPRGTNTRPPLVGGLGWIESLCDRSVDRRGPEYNSGGTFGGTVASRRHREFFRADRHGQSQRDHGPPGGGPCVRGRWHRWTS